ncbi:MAG: hypothetical protein DRG27_06415 [Deltaproteobacteria bacterium]|nr:MAG: hypothetical protein DRG27_06415 [Deltaproteobacteria bacterium]
MKCLILAAGKGSRLKEVGEPKPLVRLLGLTLIERVILTVKRCGIEEFYVVLGYRGDEVKRFLSDFSKKQNVKIHFIFNDEWDKENGVSVLKAKDVLNNDKFLLCMCDHIFSDSVAKKALESNIDNGQVALCVDFRTKNPFIPNPEEATKVLVEDGKIKDIGKNIPFYNAYDTGVFVCSPVIFKAIEESIENHNDTTLSGAIKVLADKGMVLAVDAGDNAFWMDIDDYNAYKKAEAFLIENLTKKDTDGPVSKYINRPLSIKITKYLLDTQLSPNKISFFSFLISLAASFFFFLGKYAYLLLGGILAQASSIIDGCDGEIARLKLQSSKFGAWFDAVLDRYSDAFLLFGLTMYAYNPAKSFIILFTGFMAIIGSFVNSYMADKYDQFMLKELINSRSKPMRIGRDIRVIIIFLGAILNQAFAALLFIALLMNIENIRRIMLLYEYQEKRA